MAQYRDPIKTFSPLEVVDRLLEIRDELGYPRVLYLDSSLELAQIFDALGMDAYALSDIRIKMNYGDYSTAVLPGGHLVHETARGH